MRKAGHLLLLAATASLFACAMHRGESASSAVESVTGATYYVSASGSDSNPGTATQPWRTLQKAVDTIAAGDTVLVGAGTYAGCRIGRSGAPGGPKTLRAQSGTRPVINAPGPSNAHGGIIEIENYSATVTNWIIDGFELANSPHAGVDIRGTDYITVQNCYVHNSAAGGRATGIFLAFSDHPSILNNETAYNSEHGVYQSNSGDYPTIRGNTIHHNKMAGVHMNGDLSMGGDGTISYGVIDGNAIYENGTAGGSAINMDGASDNVVKNNLIYNNHASGISLFKADGASGSSRNRIYNNTIVQASGSRWCINIPKNGSPVGNLIRNNILYHPDSAKGSISVYSASSSGFASDYNIVVNRFSVNDQTSIISLSQWRPYGYDLHSTIATPTALFVNPSTNDYHLRSGSPAIDTGTALAEVTTDFAETARPQGAAYDIGAYESGSSGGSTTTADTTAPTVSVSSPTAGASVSGVVSLSASASDNVGVAGVQFLVDGASYGPEDTSSPYAVSLDTTSLSNATHTITARARDAAGNTALASPVSVTVSNSSATAPVCTTASAGGAVSNSSFAAQTGSFSAAWDVTPQASSIDGAVGLANGVATGWSNLAAIVRFNTAGTIDARNGGSYAAATSVSYAAGVSYHVRMAVTMASRTYSVYVTPAGGTETLLASNYAFRTERQGVTQLNDAAVLADSGAIQACGFKLN